MLCENDPRLFDDQQTRAQLEQLLGNFSYVYNSVHPIICLAICPLGILANIVHILWVLSSNLIKFSRIICVISSDLIKNFVTTSSAIFCRQCLSYGRCNLWHFHDGLILHLHRSLWNYESLPQLHRNKVCFVALGLGCFSFSLFFFWCVENDIF